MNGYISKAAIARAALALIAGALLIQAAGAQAKPLTREQAIAAALSGDPRVESAAWDELAAQEKEREAKLRMLPSLSLSGSYTRLSDVTQTLSFKVMGQTMSVPMSSLDNAFSLNANLQYPVFAGFRLRESAELAKLQAQGKGISSEMIKRSLVFETERAYWEAERATLNVGMLKESLELAKQSLAVMGNQTELGTAMKADLLSAQMRESQAEMDLGAAVNMQRKAFLALESLVGAMPSSAAPEEALALVTKAEPVADDRFPSLEQGELVGRALANRPETRSAALAIVAADAGRKLAEAPLFPTLSLTGAYAFADPNQRYAFQSDPWAWNGTWSVGLALSYDLGGLPANLAERDAQADLVAKSKADEGRQRETVELDLRSCLLAFQQTRRDYGLVSGMIEQARENERVTEERVSAGTASDVELLSARIARLKVEFSIANKLIDEQIAAADLERAAALGKL